MLEAIVLGIAQGLTEFLPISSTAHLRIVPAFAGWEDPGALFTAVIQLGTMLAVVIYFWRDLVRITAHVAVEPAPAGAARRARRPDGLVRHHRDDPDRRLRPGFNDQIESGARNLYLIGTVLIVAGLVLAVADRVGRRVRDVDDVNRTDAIWVGVAQALALIPGTSRSGATITAGLFLGLKREAAARFSFLLSIPAIVLSRPLRPDGADHRRRLGELRGAGAGDRRGVRLRVRRRSRSCCGTSPPTR